MESVNEDEDGTDTPNGTFRYCMIISKKKIDN